MSASILWMILAFSLAANKGDPSGKFYEFLLLIRSFEGIALYIRINIQNLQKQKYKIKSSKMNNKFQ